MQNDDNHKPGKELRPLQNNLPATLATSKKLVQHLKTALANSRRDLVAADDGWVERLIRGLEAGINECTEIEAVIKTANGKQELDYLPRDKEIWPTLTRLQLSGNYWEEYSGLKILPVEIGKLHHLQKLELYWNQLTTLPAAIGQLPNLQTLSLSYNQLTTLPAEIGQLQNLQTLGLGRNQLTTLPAEIGQLQNLQNLWLFGNQLTTLPAEMGQLQNLQKLYLGGNQLTTLPAEIGQLQNLHKLYLDGNQLTTLPEEIGQLQNLEFLNLEDNPLRSLPESLKRLYRERNGALTIYLDNPALLDD